MTGLVAYILAKKIALGAVSGIQNLTFEGNQIIFHFNDGSTATMTVPLPKDGQDGKDGKDGKDGTNGKDGKDGISIVDIKINDDKHLICTMSDDSVIDAGEIPDDSSGGGVVRAAAKTDLPQPGEDDKLYLTLDTGTIYYWDTDEYHAVAGSASIEGTKATEQDIDDLFENDPEIDLGGSSLATKEDIDGLFDDDEDAVIDPSGSSLAKPEDIDGLFSSDD